MNIVKQENNDLSVLLKVTVSESDYSEAVEKSLREYRRKANIPGFRPGMVPMGVIKKMYGKGVTAEQSYRIATDKCFEYVKEQKIDFIGDIIPSDSQPDLDFDNDTEHEFDFELGLAPKVEIELSDKDKITYYKIKVAKEMKDAYRSNFLRRFGRLVDVETVEKDEALTVTLENDDMKIEDAYVGLISMDDARRAEFIGKKTGEVMDVNIEELYKNPSQRASMLQVKEAELKNINPQFKLTITKIRKFADPELDENFFKTAFPKGDVTDPEGLDKYIEEQITADLTRESDYLFTAQVREYLLGKAALKMPEGFLKKWLFTINEGKFSMEEIEKDFAGFIKMMSWNLIQKHYADLFKIEVSQDEALSEAKALTQMQFAQYGMGAVPEDMLASYAQNMLGNKEEASKIYEKLRESKVVEAVRKQIKVSTKSVSAEEFGKVAQSLA